jgi:circadian clock protein KaiB
MCALDPVDPHVMRHEPTKPQAAATGESDRVPYRLVLYVSGATPKSLRAIRNVRALCEKRLGGRYVLEVVDLFQKDWPEQQAEIVATPTLVRTSPPPVRTIVGDLSDGDGVLRGLDISN